MKHVMQKAAMVVFLAVIGAAPMAFAHGGYGDADDNFGGHMMGPGYGGHMMGRGGHMGWWGDRDEGGLSRDQAERLDDARDSFFRESRDLRDRISDKSAQIGDELSKQNPDRSRLNELRNQLSDLESRYDRKRLDYQLEVRKIAPQADGRYADSYGPGGCWR